MGTEATFACEPCVFIGAVEGGKGALGLSLRRDSLPLCVRRPVVFKKEAEKAFPKQETDLPSFGNTFVWA